MNVDVEILREEVYKLASQNHKLQDQIKIE